MSSGGDGGDSGGGGRGGGGTGIALHDSLKERFGFDRGIVRSYRLTHGEAAGRSRRPDDLVEESLVELGEEITTTVGTGRDWVIDVERRTSDGALMCVERWSMFGYPSGSPRAERRPTTSPAAPDGSATHREDAAGRDQVPEEVPEEVIGAFLVSAAFVRSNATANGVEVAVHHDTEAARAAGARDIFLDTATQVRLFSDRARELLGTERAIASVELRMRAPICAGDSVGFITDRSPEDPADGSHPPHELRLRALVDGTTVSTAVVAFVP